MAHVLAKSQEELDDIAQLLTKSVPSYRQAYSDRTCWIMACMSELAYLRFNPLFSVQKQKEYFLESVEKLVSNDRKPSLLNLIDKLAYDHEEEKKKLVADLTMLNMKLEKTFDKDGTQAILASADNYLVLAFRGTEAMSVRDIKADARAKIKGCTSEGNIHTGFSDAYDNVAIDIQKALNQDDYKDMPLFITGHSLGGALATIAAKKLTHRAGIASCYTFGSPRVGDEEWVSGMKTPLYRIVNAADCVTMLPPGHEVVTTLGWFVQFIPEAGPWLRKKFLSKFNGYLHGGNMRYLTNCPKGDYKEVRLLYSVSLFIRLKGLFFRQLPLNKFLSDHSISVYRKKLGEVAHKRNP